MSWLYSWGRGTSAVRVTELKEDYWWLGEVAEPLRGITLPREFSVIEDRWQEAFPGGVVSQCKIQKVVYLFKMLSSVV